MKPAKVNFPARNAQAVPVDNRNAFVQEPKSTKRFLVDLGREDVLLRGQSIAFDKT